MTESRKIYLKNIKDARTNSEKAVRINAILDSLKIKHDLHSTGSDTDNIRGTTLDMRQER